MHTVIIGNGIAGITAARHLRKQNAECAVTVISRETPYFFSRTALMYVFMGHLPFKNTEVYPRSFWAKNRITCLQASVNSINFEAQTVHLAEIKNAEPTGFVQKLVRRFWKKNQETPAFNDAINYQKLVLATGSKPVKYGWDGENLAGVQGLYSYQDLELLYKNTVATKEAVIVGGGLIGIELAEMLVSRGIKVHFLVREASFWNNILPKEESQLINEHIAEHHIDLRLGTELKAVLPDAQGNARAIRTTTGEEIACQLVGITVGVMPNIGFLKNTDLEINRGILVDEYLQTNQPNVYAIGDCAELRQHQPHRRAIEQVWYTGKMMGETLAQTLAGTPTKYKPGVWFNSAKFFDIEYQTYGNVSPNLKQGEAWFLWQDVAKKQLFRVVYAQQTGAVLGINVLNIRISHSHSNDWIANQTPIDEVINTHLAEANFNPEFFRDWVKDVQKAYNNQFKHHKNG